MGVRLAAFNLPSIAKLTMTDELHLQELGERKIALFCCMPALAMAAPARTMAAGGYFNGQRDLAGCFAAAVHSFFVECFNTIWIY